MKERDGLDRLITGVLTSSYDGDPVAGCPDDLTVSAYIDGALDMHESDAVTEHIAACTECARAVESALAGLDLPMSKPFPRVIESAADSVRRYNEGVISIAVRLVRDTIRIIGEAASPAGLEPVPAPIRGRISSPTMVSASRTVRDLNVDIEIENVGGGMAEVVICARYESDGKPVQGLRASLFRNGRETDSIMMSGGRAAFEDVPPGRYTINLTSNGFCLSDIELEIQKEL